jgi:5-methylcytosine-specific restriction endonuclease McrA
VTFTPVPKPSPRWMAKARRKADEQRELRACYKAVDGRDDHACRVCRQRVGGTGPGRAAVHHHLVYRSAGGAHATWNVLTICMRCDDLIHREGTLKVSGNADTRNSEGVLCGVTVERLIGGRWLIGEKR